MMQKVKIVLLIWACCGLPYLSMAEGVDGLIRCFTNTTFSAAFMIPDMALCSSNVICKVSCGSSQSTILIPKEEIRNLVALLDGAYLARIDVSVLKSKGISRWSPKEPRIHLSIYDKSKCLCYLDFYGETSNLFNFRRRMNQDPRMYMIKNERIEKVRPIISKWEEVLAEKNVGMGDNEGFVPD